MGKTDHRAQKRHVYKKITSPVGRLTLVATDDGLSAILWEEDPPGRVRLNLEVEGHTDAVGAADYNQDLSERRAQAVRAFLTQQGISTESIVARGFGKDQPVATNGTAAGRQQNRRVELVVSGSPIQ